MPPPLYIQRTHLGLGPTPGSMTFHSFSHAGGQLAQDVNSQYQGGGMNILLYLQPYGRAPQPWAYGHYPSGGLPPIRFPPGGGFLAGDGFLPAGGMFPGDEFPAVGGISPGDGILNATQPELTNVGASAPIERGDRAEGGVLSIGLRKRLYLNMLLSKGGMLYI
jgi:hypothetical protein